jgi:Predicted integral membrane protein
MNRGRLEAFSDGVIAIIITIMVLEMRVPHGTDLRALAENAPIFLSYVLSFIYVGIYWNNHHHLLHAVRRVGGWMLWANLHLLFWLSLFPFASAWMGEHHAAAVPTALYGVVLLMAAMAWLLFQRTILAYADNAEVGQRLGRDLKGKVSAVLYLVAIACAFWRTWLADLLYVIVAGLWFIPDRRFERTVS